MRKSLFTTVVGKTTDGTAEATISTEATDRDGNVLVAGGVVVAPFLTNPVVLFGHNHHDIPIGSATTVEVIPGRGLRARWTWLEGDEFATRVRNAWDQGVLRATSVGFVPLDYEFTESGTRFLRWELLEFSIVPVPANPEAVRALKSLGLNALTARDYTSRSEKHTPALTLHGRPFGMRSQPAKHVVTFASSNDLAARITDSVEKEIRRLRGRLD